MKNEIDSKNYHQLYQSGIISEEEYNRLLKGSDKPAFNSAVIHNLFFSRRNIIIIASVLLVMCLCIGLCVHRVKENHRLYSDTISEADKLLSEKRFDAAVLKYKEAREINVYRPDSYIGASEAYYQNGQSEKANAEIDSGVKNCPGTMLLDYQEELTLTPVLAEELEANGHHFVPSDTALSEIDGVICTAIEDVNADGKDEYLVVEAGYTDDYVSEDNLLGLVETITLYEITDSDDKRLSELDSKKIFCGGLAYVEGCNYNADIYFKKNEGKYYLVNSLSGYDWDVEQDILTVVGFNDSKITDGSSIDISEWGQTSVWMNGDLKMLYGSDLYDEDFEYDSDEYDAYLEEYEEYSDEYSDEPLTEEEYYAELYSEYEEDADDDYQFEEQYEESFTMDQRDSFMKKFRKMFDSEFKKYGLQDKFQKLDYEKEGGNISLLSIDEKDKSEQLLCRLQMGSDDYVWDEPYYFKLYDQASSRRYSR